MKLDQTYYSINCLIPNHITRHLTYLVNLGVVSEDARDSEAEFFAATLSAKQRLQMNAGGV
jgi:hypothetical protein